MRLTQHRRVRAVAAVATVAVAVATVANTNLALGRKTTKIVNSI